MNVKLTYQAAGNKGAWPTPKGTAPRVGGFMGRYVRNAEGKVVRLSATPEAIPTASEQGY